MRRDKRSSIGKPVLLVSLAFILGFFAVVGTANGQVRDEVRAELEKTDELLDHARDIVKEFGSNRGRNTVESAEQLQRRAWDAFNRGRLKMARQFTDRAREEVYRALGTIRQSEENENEVERQLERTDAVLNEIRDRVGPGSPGTPRRRLETAFRTQRRAWDLYRERRLRPALRVTLQARETVLRMAAGLQGTGTGRDYDPEALAAQLERLTEAAERVGGRVAQSDNAAAEENWRQANATLERARTAMNVADFSQAERLLRRVREQLDRVGRTVLEDVRAGEVSVLIEAANERWERLGSVVQEAEEDRFREWHRLAKEDLDQARRALENDRIQRALIHTRKAAESLDRIENELGE